MRILIAGGAGYCGSYMVPQLLAKGHDVTVYDTFWFGNFLPMHHPRIKIILGDIRDADEIEKKAACHDVFIDLACVSNDASFELDEKLSTSINYDAFEPMVLAAKRAGIKRFIYASSSSVYGVSDQPEVTENHPLVPLTLYNKFKGMCEPLLFKHTDKSFTGVIFRPATVCGYSPRMRLDLSVNILTMQAITKGVITVYGGSQKRPNLHIHDYCRVVEELINAPDDLVANQIFNVGAQNLTIMGIALIVRKTVMEYMGKKDIKIITHRSIDKRSYHINSEKIERILDFYPINDVMQAVIDICKAYDNGLFKDHEADRYYNVRRLKGIRAI